MLSIQKRIMRVLSAMCLASTMALFGIVHRVEAGGELSTVIVELASAPVIVAKYDAEQQGQHFDVEAYRQTVIAEQNRFLERVKATGISYTIAGVSAPNGETTADIKFRFNYVYNGVTLVVPTAAVEKLKQITGVVAVHPAEELRVDLDRAIDYVRASELYGATREITPFDDQRLDGLEGQGMIVAVIDTGIDWAHPMFGMDPTPPQFGVGPAVANSNRKVIYYLNLTAGVAGDDFGHGTHVAADIAGYAARAPGKDMIPLTADDVEIHGVAPQAKLMGYKTLSAVGTGLNPSTIMAIEDAVQPYTITGIQKPVPHIINLSLGSTVNDPNSPTSVACDNATLAGVTVVASAGNSGAATTANPTGEATIGSPGTGRRVITVGANNDPGFAEDFVMERAFDSGRPLDLTDVLDPAGLSRTSTGLVDGTNKATAAGARTNIPVNLAGGSPALGNPVAQYYVFAGTIASPADVPDSVAGRIAIARPSGAFAGTSTALAAKGAAAAIIIRPDLAKITVAHATIPTWSIQETDARYLLDMLASNDPLGVDPAKGVLSEFPVRVKQGSFTPAMASFSSKGPVGGFGQVKPDITAPGVGILSATVRVGGVSPAPSFMFHPSGYISASGTSFSSPITAGVAALIKQAHRKWTPSMIRASLINTATNLRQADGTPVADGVQTLNNQGGGLIDAAAAVNATALMGTGSPGPTGKAPTTRPHQIGVGPLVGTSPGNPDFSASYSFGEVRIAGVEGTATHTVPVNIHDVSDGSGAGTYQLSASNVRSVDGTNFRVSFTNASGEEITSVEVPARGSASFNVKTVANGAQIANPSQIQFYVSATREDGGQRLRMPFYYRAVAPVVSMAAPGMGNISGAELAYTPPLDINGSYRLQFSAPAGGSAPSRYRIQESSNGGATWTNVAEVPASQTSFDIEGKGNGTYQYRVVGLFPVEYGVVVGPASAVRTIAVDRRVEADVTALIEGRMVPLSLSYDGTHTKLNWTIRNKSADTTVYPIVTLFITSIQASSGEVRVANAENSGDGVNTPAAFGYSTQVGTDFTPGETSAARELRFINPTGEMFGFTAIVRGHFRDAGAGSFSAGSTEGGDSQSSGSSTTGTGLPSADGLGLGSQGTTVLKFIVNPQTGTVTLVP